MANGYQSFSCFGNVGADPELRTTKSGTAFLSLRLAVTESRKRGDEWVDETQWFSVVVWGRRAESLHRIIGKGDRLLVIGRIEFREWEDRDGNRRNGIEVVADNVVLGGSPRSRDQQGGRSQRHQGGYSEPSQGQFGDDDIPF